MIKIRITIHLLRHHRNEQICIVKKTTMTIIIIRYTLMPTKRNDPARYITVVQYPKMAHHHHWGYMTILCDGQFTRK